MARFINRTKEMVLIYADEPGFPLLYTFEPVSPAIEVDEFTHFSEEQKEITGNVTFVKKSYGDLLNFEPPKNDEFFIVSQKVFDEIEKRASKDSFAIEWKRALFSIATPDFGSGAVRFYPGLGNNREKGPIVGTTALVIHKW
jgi:hypothetical protein